MARLAASRGALCALTPHRVWCVALGQRTFPSHSAGVGSKVNVEVGKDQG